jgi:hypothetical protein
MVCKFYWWHLDSNSSTMTKYTPQIDLNVGLVEEVQIQVDNEIVLNFDLHELSSKIEIDFFML